MERCLWFCATCGVARQAAEAVNLNWTETNSLVLRRVCYIIAAGLDESISNEAPLILHGRFNDLFDAQLPVLDTVTLSSGKRALLFDVDAIYSERPLVVEAACNATGEHWQESTLSFAAQGIADTEAVV